MAQKSVTMHVHATDKKYKRKKAINYWEGSGLESFIAAG